MCHETAPFTVFICNKKIINKIFLKSKLQIMKLKISALMLGFKNYFLTYSALQTLVSPNLLLHFQCFVLQQPKQIKHFKFLSKICTNRQCTEPGFWLYSAKLCSTLHHSITDKSSSFESRCYLILEVHNTLITILLKQQINGTFNLTSYPFFLPVELFQGDFLNKLYI